MIVILPFYETQASELTVIHNMRELSFSSHIHDHIEILYVFSGTQHLIIDDKEYAVNEGELAIIFPNLIHTYYKADKKNADGLIILCSSKITAGIFPNLNNYTAKHPIIHKNQIHPNVVYACENILSADKFSLKLGWFFIIFSHILENIEIVKHTNFSVENITKKIIEYISLNFKEPISLDLLAETFHVSKYYISHVFSDKIKMNFKSYLGIVRAEYAAVLIRTTNDSLTNISINSGFESLRTFNRVFKKHYGMTPREYRYNSHDIK